MTTLLIAEHDNASLKDSTNKALTAAAALGAEVHVLVAGENAKAAADAASKLNGVAKVLLADNAAYAHDLAEPLAALVVSLAPSYDAFVAPATSRFKNVMPRVARLLPIPRRFDAKGVQRFGFHGLSYEYIMHELRRLDGAEADGRVVIAHLGNGASMAARPWTMIS